MICGDPYKLHWILKGSMLQSANCIQKRGHRKTCYKNSAIYEQILKQYKKNNILKQAKHR